MSRRNGVLLSIGLVVLAGAAGFGVARYFTARVPEGPGGRSETARIACSLVVDPGGKHDILKKDEAFMREYRALCARLCETRAQLSALMPQASWDDPATADRLGQIHQTQAELENLTLKHILDVRDTLPAPEREPFIRAVQDSWEQEQAHMMRIAGGCCDASGVCVRGGGTPAAPAAARGED